MFKYIILGLLGYWILKRVFKISQVVQQDGKDPIDQNRKNNPPQDNHGGEYVDYEEVE
ncbi:MAG: hypothetical protein RLZZ337_457 [Bacteroidota bacterium]|jgi:hypothetical protein